MIFGPVIRGQTLIRITSADAVGSFIGRHQDVRPFVQLYGNGRNRPDGTFRDRGDIRVAKVVTVYDDLLTQ